MGDLLKNMDTLEEVVRYHQQTKHHYHQFARSLGYLDWANQPDPFRRFDPAPLVPLPLSPPDEPPASPGYDAMFQAGGVTPVPLSLRSLSRFLEYALALTAWKQAGGTRWALRSNPSSGNLHPTEGYVWIGALTGLGDTPGLYHYAPKEHALERRAESTPELFTRIMAAFPAEAFLVGLSSVHWREAWKYGERAFRYCQHDAGHAIGTIRIAAATLGWKAMLLNGASDATIEMLLGLNREADFSGVEREHPDCLMAIWPAAVAGTQVAGGCRIPLFLDEAMIGEQERQTWFGKANRLSPEEPLNWEIIGQVSRASWKPGWNPRLSTSPKALLAGRTRRRARMRPPAARRNTRGRSWPDRSSGRDGVPWLSMAGARSRPVAFFGCWSGSFRVPRGRSHAGRCPGMLFPGTRGSISFSSCIASKGSRRASTH